MSTQLEAQKVHSEVRIWFKGKIKSDNKNYDFSHYSYGGYPHHDTVSDHFLKKLMRRSINLNQAYHYVNDHRDSFDLDPVTTDSILTYAKHLYHIGTTQGQIFGNCYEYTAMTLLFAKNNSISSSVYYIEADDGPADHIFCLFSPLKLHSHFAISEMVSFHEDIWIVDSWANIVCPAYLYTNNLFLKARQWQHERKQIKQAKYLHGHSRPLWDSAIQFYMNTTKAFDRYPDPAKSILKCIKIL